MGHISREDVVKIAHLSRIELEEAQIDRFTTQLESILAYMEKLGEVDLEGVEPFLNAATEDNVFREDAAGEPLAREEGLAGAPKQADGFFVVPQVTGD